MSCVKSVESPRMNVTLKLHHILIASDTQSHVSTVVIQSVTGYCMEQGHEWTVS